MKLFVRGSTVRLKFNFYDTTGAIVNPVNGANVTVSYIPLGGGDPTFATYALTQSGNDWTYDWDSSVSEPCIVSAHAATAAPSPISTVDVDFRLKANRANKELAGDDGTGTGY